MNYYDEIKEKLLKSEVYGRVKDYSKDRNKVITYFETGKLLSDAGKHYGKNIIKSYSEKLMVEVGKKYNERTLYGMRKFYEVFSDEKLNTLCSKLSWSHYRELVRLRNIDEIKYYISICEKQNLSQRQLQEKIKNHEYDRLSDETKNKLIKLEELKIEDMVPNPIMIKVNYLNEKITEYALKEAILNNLDDFLLELGSGFSYIGNEYKIKMGSQYNYLDLLLFNYEYNSFFIPSFTNQTNSYSLAIILSSEEYLITYLLSSLHIIIPIVLS